MLYQNMTQRNRLFEKSKDRSGEENKTISFQLVVRCIGVITALSNLGEVCPATTYCSIQVLAKLPKLSKSIISILENSFKLHLNVPTLSRLTFMEACSRSRKSSSMNQQRARDMQQYVDKACGHHSETRTRRSELHGSS